jgi:hypothetical protein
MFGPIYAAFRAHPDVLLGWKEIAAALGHSERTVRRWRDDYGLPVRKYPRYVALSRQDIDYWILQMDGLQRRLAADGIPGRRGSGRPRRK